MTSVTVVVASAAALTVGGAGAQSVKTPRLAITIKRASEPGQLRATVENLAAAPVLIEIVPAFALRPTGSAGRGRPSFRAPVDLDTARPLRARERTLLRLGARQRQTIVVGLEALYWDHAQSALWPSRPLRRVVLPGTYDLSLEIADPDSGDKWLSSGISAIVTDTGTLEIAGSPSGP